MSSTYRKNFVNSAKPLEYEKQYAKRSYGEIIWTIEKQQLLDFLLGFRQGKLRIDYLDFAAGTGRIISALEDHVDSAVGIEISPVMAEIAQNKLQHGRIVCKDITLTDSPIEGKYDLITAFRFFLNAEPELKRTAMDSLVKRLKDESSRLIFTNHGNLWSHKLLMWPVHAIRRAGKGYIEQGNYMTLKQARRLAGESGLIIENVMGCGVLSSKSEWLIPFDILLGIESRLSATAFARCFGVNQMFVARLNS